MTNSSTVEMQGYLEQLRLLLADLPADVRDDVVGGISEHLQQVAGEGDERAIHTALTRLGSPETVAAAARAEVDLPMAASSSTEARSPMGAGGNRFAESRGSAPDSAAVPRRTSLADRWTLWVGALAALFAIDGFLALGAAMSFTARFDEDADWNVHPALILFGIALSLLAGIFATILFWSTPSWPRRHKLWLSALWPLAAMAMILGSSISAALPPGAGFLVAGVFVLLGALVTALVGRWTLQDTAA
ncbi:hypothetical protein AB0P21_24650 [Kribbella sp. NPDC056861]|uniref:HAAS signaling domain-containing protein n=1 Tax=Kribbella sp. NPDC056861 TaxID=3154857 RepID=UPI00341A70A5